MVKVSAVVNISELGQAFHHQEMQRKERALKNKLYRKKEERIQLENEIPRLEEEHLNLLREMNKQGIKQLS